MALLDDNGQPIFAEFAPPPAAATPSDPPPVDPAPNPNATPPSAAAPTAAEPLPTGTDAEPYAAMPDQPDDAPLPDDLPAPSPESPNWDDPGNPWRQEAERAYAQAQAAQQTIAQQQAYELANAERLSRQRQAALMQQRVQLDARVGDLSPEDFQRASLELNRRLAAELQNANASKQAIVEHFGRQQEFTVWDQTVAQTAQHYGLSPDEVAHVNAYAKDTNHLDQLARDFKSRRDERSQYQSVTRQLAQLRSDQQRLRSEAAANRRATGADRTGGVGGSPVPTPAPDSALGLLRLAVNGNVNAPVNPR